MLYEALGEDRWNGGRNRDNCCSASRHAYFQLSSRQSRNIPNIGHVNAANDAERRVIKAITQGKTPVGRIAGDPDPLAHRAAPMKKRFYWGVWGVLVLALAALLAFPMRSKMIRLAIVALFFVVGIGLLVLTWKTKGVRYTLLALSVAGMVFIALPGRRLMDIEALRGIYVSKLKSYDGTRYVWGGENHLGIDCSGLVRIALADALFEYGLRHLDPSALRSGFYLWWHDSNAVDLGRPASVLTTLLGDGSLTRLSAGRNQLAGDLAVTQAGSHVLAYLGGDMWIEAEPGVGSTHIFDLNGKFNYLADQEVRFVRWTYLNATPAKQGTAGNR